MSELARIQLPTWREDAIARCVAMYDLEDEDGQPLVKLKRTATDIERFSALIELLDEVFPEASALVRSSKAAPKTRLTVVLGRLDEISLDGRRFAEIKPGQYDWTDADEGEQEEEKPKPKGERKQAPKVDDEYVKKVVQDTEPPKPPARATTRQTKPRTTKAPAKPAAKTTTTRKRTTTK